MWDLNSSATTDSTDPRALSLPRGWRNEDPEPRGCPAEGRKKKVTTPILTAEVVVDVPKETSDGSPGVQDVFESL